MFDIDKAVATAAYITKRRGGRISTFILIKMMYASEREALTRWHRPITGDTFFSMHKGPILSRVYDLIKGGVANTNSDMAKWSKHFSPRSGNYITLIADADLDYLSEREREVIEIAMKEIETLMQTHGLIAEVLHQKWPEWKDPQKFGGKSIPLSLEDVLMEVTEDDADVSVIRSEIQAVQSAKAALQVSIG